LAAQSASDIDPHYGIDSSDLHSQAGFERLGDVDPRARADVDQIDDLMRDWNPGARVRQLMADIGG
jgi:hypothetical protein